MLFIIHHYFLYSYILCPPSHLGVAGFLDGQISIWQVTGDRDAELLR